MHKLTAQKKGETDRGKFEFKASEGVLFTLSGDALSATSKSKPISIPSADIVSFEWSVLSNGMPCCCCSAIRA